MEKKKSKEKDIRESHSLKGLPSRQFQDIKKKLRKQALIIIAKKNILLRAIKELKKESILALQEHVKENCAFAISDLEGFELAAVLIKNKNPIFAKAGQISPRDIEVKEGLTNLTPGPAISEFGALGIQIAVEEGKISIKKTKTIIYKEDIIKENIASLLQKLEIKPFEIGIEPIVIYDLKEEKIYTNININPEKTVKELSSAAGKSLGFAQKISYICKETIGYFLAKANAHAEALSKFAKQENKEEIKNE
jgi:large subunit ribosomal protein L10